MSEPSSGLLISFVSIDANAELAGMNFSIVKVSPNIVILINLESVIPRRDSFAGIAEYSSVDGRLRIPAPEVNLSGSVSMVRNMVFVLTEAAPPVLLWNFLINKP